MSIFQIDLEGFQFINNLAASITILNPFMRFLAQDAEYLFYLAMIIYWFTRTNQNRRMVVQALISACTALGVGGILSTFFYRDRPFVTHHVIQLVQHAANASFPSDHATGAFVIATSIWLFRRREGIAWLIIASFITLSRVWTGVHYPSDVVAGAFIGFTTAILVHRLFARSLLAQKCLNYGIGIYEKVEQKVWGNSKGVKKV